MSKKTNQQPKQDLPKVTIPSNLVLDLSLCLSDMPKQKMTKGSNGKIYLNICVAARKDPDQWGRDLKVYVNQSKEEREAGAAKVYVGAGKTIQVQAPTPAVPSQGELDDLPF